MSPSESEVILALYESKTGLTRHQIAIKTHRLDHSICARIGALRNYVNVVGRRHDRRTKFHVSVYMLNERGVKAAKKLATKRKAA